MKENKIFTVCLSGVVASVVLFIITCCMLVSNGYARDAGIYVSTFLSKGLWINLILSIISGVLFFKLPRLQNKKPVFITTIIILIIFFIYGLSVNIGWKISYEQVKNADFQHENLKHVSLDEMQNVLLSDEFQVVYIGSDSCPLCEYTMPDFIEFLEAEELDVLYFNTKYDRDTRSEELDQMLNSISVYGVPVIMIIENKEVIEIFDGQYMVDDLKSYLYENYF